MDKDGDIFEYLDKVKEGLLKYSDEEVGLGQELQQRIKLSKTDEGARTNARILAAQKQEGFNEKGVAKKELDNVGESITNELLERVINDIFGER